MTFETEYQILEFRKIQDQYFDEKGEAYTPASSIDKNIKEQMLKLINQMETEIKDLQHFKDTSMGLFCIDRNPKYVEYEWILKNNFQLT